jgi:hypothetical protein
MSPGDKVQGRKALMTLRRLVLFVLIFCVGVSLRAQSSLDNILSPARLPVLKDFRLKQVSSGDTTGGNTDFVAIPAGATVVIADLKGPGVIVGMWCTVASPDTHFLRRTVLRCYWDGESAPSVEVPLGDFFGTGFQYKQYVTQYLGMSSGGYYCYFPMPFNGSARIEVGNETGEEITSFYYHIDYQQLSRPLEPDVAYFHAAWHREPRTNPHHSYTVLEAEGRGHFVGLNMSMQSYNNDTQYLEGDEEVFVDGEARPSIAGTGTEDYFNSGWYFNQGEFAAPYHGLIVKDTKLQRIAAYRFHILDAIPFARSLKFNIEHGDQNVEIADYSSTAYWYQIEPHKPFAQLPPAGMRIPLRVVVPNGALEAESLRPTDTDAKWTVEDMTQYGAEWSGMKQLRVSMNSSGGKFHLALPADEEEYDVSIYFTRGSSYGNWAVYQDSLRLGGCDGYSAGTRHGGCIIVKGLKPVQGLLHLQFVADGRHAKATGSDIGLDAFVLQPRRHFIPEWFLLGPFANPRDAKLNRLGLDIPYAPEKGIDLSATHRGVNDQEVRWTLTKTPEKGRVDLYQFDPYEMVVVYALTYVFSPKEQTLPLLLGSDDGVKVFLNAREVHRILAVRVASPDQDRVPLSLKKGWNALLLKIENNYGGYNFYARIPDATHSLLFSPMKKQ